MVYFAGYGFNKSHSAAYAYVAWQTAYLKAHYRAEFMAATMTSMIKRQQQDQLLRRRMPPPRRQGLIAGRQRQCLYVFRSGGAIRFGLSGVKSVGGNAIDAIVKAREEGGPFFVSRRFLQPRRLPLSQ